MAYLRCNNIKIYYEITGKGMPIVLINGIGCDTRSWEFLIPFLASSFQVINFDMRGSGKSDKPDKPYTISEITNDTYDLLSGLNIKRANILGFSLGGCVAIELAINHPEIIDKLILLSTTPSLKKPYPPTETAKLSLNQTEVTPDSLKNIYDIIYGPDFKKRFKIEEFIKMRMEDPYPQPSFAYINQLHALNNFDMCDKVDRIADKTLIIAGSNDNMIPPDNSKWLHKKIMHSKLSIIKDAGHILPVECPDTLNKIIKTFLLGD